MTQRRLPQPSDIQAVIDARLARGRAMGARGRELEIFPTGVRREDGEALRRIVREEGAAHTLETGLAFGISTLYICQGLLENGAPDISHIAIDPLQEEFDRVGIRTLEEAGLEELVRVHERGSELVLPALAAEGHRVDVAFIDGFHRFDIAFVDLFYASRIVKPGGLIIVDDTWMPSVRMAIDYFARNLGLAYENRIDEPVEPQQRSPGSDVVAEWGSSPQESMARLRVPEKPFPRAWNELVAFGFDY